MKTPSSSRPLNITNAGPPAAKVMPYRARIAASESATCDWVAASVTTPASPSMVAATVPPTCAMIRPGTS